MATKKQAAEATEHPRYVSITLEQQEVEVVASAKDADTFHKPVVQEGVQGPGGDPANAPVIVGADVIEDFQYPRTTRPARRLVAAAGTLTTRRLAEENGITGVSDWSPAGDEPDTARPQFSTPISTEEARSGAAEDEIEPAPKSAKASKAESKAEGSK